MRSIRYSSLALALLVVAMAGCSSENKGKIEGTKWSSLQTKIGANTLPPGALSLEFTKDGKVTYMADKKYTGTYSLGWGKNVTLNLNQAIDGRKKHTEKISIENNQLTMTDSDGTSIKFSRVSQ